MTDKTDHLRRIIVLSQALEKKGFQPVLVGGIALVLMGSQRVTRDFDFLISLRDSSAEKIAAVFYEQGFELVTKFNNQGEVLRTIDSQNIASIKLKKDLPDSLFFFDWTTRLKVDLLLDFPLPASEVLPRSTRLKIKSGSLQVASAEDLLRLKELSYADRHSASDAQDLEFLKRLLKRR